MYPKWVHFRPKMRMKKMMKQFSLKTYMSREWIKMMLKHPFLLGSMLENEKYEELDEELGRTLRAFSCFFPCGSAEMKKRERVRWSVV